MQFLYGMETEHGTMTVTLDGGALAEVVVTLVASAVVRATLLAAVSYYLLVTTTGLERT